MSDGDSSGLTAQVTRVASVLIFGALMLYLDFINMFMFILHLFGNRE